MILSVGAVFQPRPNAAVPVKDCPVTEHTATALPPLVPVESHGLSGALLKRVLVAWVLALLATGVLVEGIQRFAPRLLWRDQSAASWHLQREAWEILESAPYGTDERTEALERAVELFREAADKTPSVGRYRMNLAQALEELDRDQEAFEEAIAAIPHCASDDAQSYDFAALMASRVSAWDDAERLARHAIEVAPTEVRPRETLAQALIALERIDEAMEVYQARLDELPATPEVRIEIGKVAARVGRYDKVAQWYGDLADLGLIQGPAWQILAIARAAQNDVQGAAVALAHYARDYDLDRPVYPDFEALGLPPLQGEAEKALLGAYRRGFAAEWR